jgi:hypothetical protein
MEQEEHKTLRQDWSARVAVALFALLTAWWLGVAGSNTTGESGHAELLWGASYQAVAIWGGLFGLFAAGTWGGRRSVMGRAILAFAIGLLLQTFGQTVFSFYNLVSQVEIPYPSLADLGFFGSIPLYVYGTLMLAKASGVNVSLKTFSSKIQAIVIPLVLLGFSYSLFLRGYEFDWSSPLRVFLDFGYPLGQAFYVSLALLAYLLTKKTLGGIMKNKVLFILIALVVQYVADYNFLTQAYAGTWQNGGYGDLIYLTAYLFMAIGLIQLKPEFIRPTATEPDKE